MKKGVIIAVIFLLAAVLSLNAAPGGTPDKRTVYMFGVAESFTDSVLFMTEVQEVEAYVHSNGFLANRSLYSLQLNNSIVTNQQIENVTCAVFFDKSLAKATKRWEKMNRRFREKGIAMPQTLRADEFTFEAEEWMPETVTYGDPGSGEAKKRGSGEVKKDKKKRKK